LPRYVVQLVRIQVAVVVECHGRGRVTKQPLQEELPIPLCCSNKRGNTSVVAQHRLPPLPPILPAVQRSVFYALLRSSTLFGAFRKLVGVAPGTPLLLFRADLPTPAHTVIPPRPRASTTLGRSSHD
jgi:hypothetical protein